MKTGTTYNGNPNGKEAQMAYPLLSGSEIRKLFRIHQWTVRSFSERYQITLERIREVRREGIPAGPLSWVWTGNLTGQWGPAPR